MKLITGGTPLLTKDIQRSRTVNWTNPAELTQAGTTLDGLSLITQLASGENDQAPLLQMLGSRVSHITPGEVEIECEVQEFHYNLLGQVHGGFFSALLDSAMGYSVLSMLPKDKVFTTATLECKLIRPLSTDSGMTTTKGKVLHLGRTLATAEAELLGPEGKLHAKALCTCVILDRPTTH